MLDKEIYVEYSGGLKALNDPNGPKTIIEWLLDLGKKGIVYALVFEGNVYAKVDSGEPNFLKCYQVKDDGLHYLGRNDCGFVEEVPREIVDWFNLVE